MILHGYNCSQLLYNFFFFFNTFKHSTRLTTLAEKTRLKLVKKTTSVNDARTAPVSRDSRMVWDVSWCSSSCHTGHHPHAVWVEDFLLIVSTCNWVTDELMVLVVCVMFCVHTGKLVVTNGRYRIAYCLVAMGPGMRRIHLHYCTQSQYIQSPCLSISRHVNKLRRVWFSSDDPCSWMFTN